MDPSPSLPLGSPASVEPRSRANGESTISFVPGSAADQGNGSTEDSAPNEQLDRYIEALQGEKQSPSTVIVSDSQLGPLRQMADRIHQLDQFLAAPVPRFEIGKYSIREILGTGGQATTYKVWDPDLARHAVIKLYHGAKTVADVAMVLDEGQALARVRHRRVAQCFSVERHEGDPYLVIEYIPGASLAELYKGSPLQPNKALALIAEVADGLAAVHACGLLHRDLKPANILLGADGSPRLVDFGLAKPLGDAGLESISGTLAYMPPEQACGDIDRIDPRTDLFGLGAVLYFLLTGAPPYRDMSKEELWKAARAGDVIPVQQRASGIPADVAAVCMRCLAKDPTKRFASAAELIQAITRVQHSRRRRLWLVSSAAALFLALAIVFGVLAKHRQGVQLAVEPSGEALQNAALDSDGHPLRQDFALNVELLNTHKDPDGKLYRIREGNLIGFRIESATTCYVGIWYDNQEGKVTQLFPNEFDSNHLVTAGKPRLVPGESDYQIPARAARIPGRMRIVASTERWNPIVGRKVGPFVVFATEEELVALRNFDVENKTKKISELVFQIQVEPH